MKVDSCCYFCLGNFQSEVVVESFNCCQRKLHVECKTLILCQNTKSNQFPCPSCGHILVTEHERENHYNLLRAQLTMCILLLI